MCIVFVCTSSPRYSLVVASNRDEFLGRPTAALAWQDGAREPFVAGRDLSAGGTWLGITRSGRWGVLTNFTEPASAAGTTVRSRGELVSDWLASDASVAAHATGVRPGEYAGFSVLLGDAAAPETPATVWYVSNRAVKPSHRVEAETFGLSNSTLLEPWPKVEAGRAAFSRALEGAEGEEALIDGCWKVLSPAEPTPLDRTSMRSSISIPPTRLPSKDLTKGGDEWYGTRVSTVLLVRRASSELEAPTARIVERDIWMLNEQGEPVRGTEKREEEWTIRR